MRLPGVPHEVHWHEGMLLVPQHFQQSALRTERLVNYRIRTANPYAFGVVNIDVDRALLLDGMIRLQGLDLIMPDGAVVQLASQNPDDFAVDLRPYAEDLRRAPMKIFAAIPAMGGANEDQRIQGELARYEASEGEAVADIHSGEGGERIMRQRPAFSLLVTNDPSRKFVSLPIAEVTRRNEVFEITDYVPPCLSIAPSSSLGLALNTVIRRIREKAVFLRERTRGLEAESREGEAAAVRITVASLTAMLPRLEALAGSGRAHPFDLFLSLCDLVGAMSTLSPSLVPPALKTYDHLNIRANFQEALDYINECLDRVHQNYLTIVFDEEATGFSIQLRPEWDSGNLIIGARTRPGQRDEDVVSWINTAVVGTRERVQGLRERRMLGASRTLIDREVSMELVQTRGIILFAVKADANFIDRDGVLEVSNTLDRIASHKPQELILYLSNRGKSGGA